jgi:hypothetical protein
MTTVSSRTDEEIQRDVCKRRSASCRGPGLRSAPLLVCEEPKRSKSGGDVCSSGQCGRRFDALDIDLVQPL